MNELKIFEHPDFGAIRTVTIDDEPWLVGKDVAQVLGYSNTKDALSTHVDDEDKRILQRSEIATIENHIPKSALPINFTSADIPNRGLTIINESGLYSLVLSSKLPGAKKFKRWVTSEVLPSIRKHGAYMTDETIEQVLSDPDTIIRLATQLKEERSKNKALAQMNTELRVEKQIMQPKADYFDELVDRNLLTNFRETAKQFGIKEKVFIRFLLDKKYIYRDQKGHLMPYAEKAGDLFEVKESTNNKTGWIGTQTLVTPKGRETFRLLCKGL